MNPCSLPFLFFFIGVLAVSYWISNFSYQRFFLSAVNLSFLSTLISNWTSGVFLAAFLLSSYLVLLLARTKASNWVVVIATTLLVGSFLFIKKYVFLALLLPTTLFNHSVEVIGISYMLFKFLHVVVDVRQGQAPPITLLAYLNYQLAFFTLIAGPIQRFTDFQKYWCAPEPTRCNFREALDSWNRIFNGMLKMGILAGGALFLYERAGADILLHQSRSSTIANFLIYFYAYPAFLYFNFSGYTDIVLGCARLLGLNLPENFDRPYLARNVIDFWNRWHISLTLWIRDYVFMTSYKWVAERSVRFAWVSGYMLTFSSLLIAGIWHGATANFAVFGAIHGLGAVVAQLYGAMLRRGIGAAATRRYNQIGWVRNSAIFITFHFVCISFIFFPSDLQMTFHRLHMVVESLR